jgi:hypothetical protein
MCRPQPWQYAKPTGVCVPQRGHAIVEPCGARGAPATGAGIAAATGIGRPAEGNTLGVCGSVLRTPAPIAGDPGVVWPRPVPQLRQNFMPGGFSPRHIGQMTLAAGNPAAMGGVCAGTSALPQFRQNDDPGGLSWPQTEQRISPL